MAQNVFDRRRINGPEESFAPIFEDEDDGESLGWKLGKPRKGRLPTDIRPICAVFILSERSIVALIHFFRRNSSATRVNYSSEWISLSGN